MPSWNSDAELNLGCEIGLRNLIGKSGQETIRHKSKRKEGGGTINADKQRKKANKAGRQTKNEEQKEERKEKRQKKSFVALVLRLVLRLCSNN